MKARGQGLLTLLVAAVVVIGAFSFARLGPREPSGVTAGTASSATWLCPHGGGTAYEGTIFLANPGDTDVDARVTAVDAGGTGDSSEMVVPASSQVVIEVDASDRSSSTFVETFGGWVAAGWLIRGAEGEVGIGAEPCTPNAGRDWVSAGASTGEGEDAFLVVMNPFDTDAVFDVALFAAERAPVRDSELTDVTLRARRSTSIALNEYAQGEAGLGVSIEVSSGRVAASTLVVSEGRGITSVLAADAPGDRHVMLTREGETRSQLSVAVPTASDLDAGTPAPPGQLGTTFAATLRSQEAPQPAGGLADQVQEPESAVAYPVTIIGSSAVDLVVRDGAPVVTALRTPGPGNDEGATGGSGAMTTSWVVTPTIAGRPARPGLLVLNPGQAEAIVAVTSIPAAPEDPAETTITVPAGGVASVPRAFLEGVSNASLLVTADGAPIVALGASTSLGNAGLSVYGLAGGVPIPEP